LIFVRKLPVLIFIKKNFQNQKTIEVRIFFQKRKKKKKKKKEELKNRRFSYSQVLQELVKELINLWLDYFGLLHRQ
jgi:hypothetical protein